MCAATGGYDLVVDKKARATEDINRPTAYYLPREVGREMLSVLGTIPNTATKVYRDSGSDSR
jgi:hypothetical protein